MKRAFCGMMVLGVVLFAAGVSMGNTGQVVLSHPDSTGAFYWSANPSGGDWTGPDPFATFCVENQEYTNPGQTYYYTLSTTVIDNGTGHSFPLAVAAAWIYDLYRKDASLHNATNRELVQTAIWALLNEQAAPVGNWAYTAAKSSAMNWGTDLHGYGVMNVWTDQACTGHAQDVLTPGPIPEPLTILSATLAFGGLGAYLRKRAKSASAA
jgi:hypothetical protein